MGYFNADFKLSNLRQFYSLVSNYEGWFEYIASELEFYFSFLLDRILFPVGNRLDNFKHWK